MTEKTKHELADDAAELVQDVLVNLQRVTGIPTDCLLVGAHAQIVAMMTTQMGGPMTAKACEWMADQVRNLPSTHASALAFALAFARPAGRA